MKYIYPAKFTYTTNDPIYPKGVYEVQFLDLESCYTFGTSLNEAYENAEDVLNLYLCGLENEKASIPTPTNHKNITCADHSFISLVSANTSEYRKKYF